MIVVMPEVAVVLEHFISNLSEKPNLALQRATAMRVVCAEFVVFIAIPLRLNTFQNIV
jgi:hypothetical protein